MSWSITYVVVGEPAPKGSKRAFHNKATGRTCLVESSKKARPFAQAVAFETARAIASAGWTEPVDEPVMVELEFNLPRPSSAPKRVVLPAKKPDLDKLERCVLDGITEGGLWTDDARVVDLHSRKVFGTPLGVTISVRGVTP